MLRKLVDPLSQSQKDLRNYEGIMGGRARGVNRETGAAGGRDLCGAWRSVPYGLGSRSGRELSVLSISDKRE
jgi:hypothetical protein